MMYFEKETYYIWYTPYDAGNFEWVVDDVCCLTTDSSTGCLPAAPHTNINLAEYVNKQ